MREAIVIAQFQRRLIELGCPSRRLREKVRELAEHYEDLKQAALEEGTAENEAEARANTQLGDPIFLAENTLLLLRQSSWWGRHPVIGFCLLPPLCFIPAWLSCGGILVGTCWLLGWIFGPAYKFDSAAISALADDPTLVENTATPINSALMACAIVMVALTFSWLARRSALGLKWILTACAFCSLNSFFAYLFVGPRAVGFGYSWRSEHWYYAGIPLLIGLAAFLRQRNMENRLAPIPTQRRASSSRITPKKLQTPFYRTPTCWVLVILTAVILKLIIVGLAASSIGKARKAELKGRIWPAERAATLALLQSRQSIATPPTGETINLRPFLNATLSDSTDGPATGRTNTVKMNNLAELPPGRRPFAGVLFDVEGRIQLAGKPLPAGQQKFPGRVNTIPIARRCARIHLLHGASDVHALGRKIARLVLHYEDGSKAEFGLVSGRDVLDWWGPIYNTESGDGRKTSSPGTELAWAGGNPGIKKQAPDFSLRLYRTTFANPHPALAISSIDYISTLSGAAPFLVGLTVE